MQFGAALLGLALLASQAYGAEKPFFCRYFIKDETNPLGPAAIDIQGDTRPVSNSFTELGGKKLKVTIDTACKFTFIDQPPKEKTLHALLLVESARLLRIDSKCAKFATIFHA
ncbi:hypothetical protein PspLS_05136 [Pyricularia sp. CBS 133598]|nr:hypothetical protein PspLS_05136 [Pyricularia sp. CBS 133598]